MISKLEINGVHMKVSDELDKYVHKKIAKLDHYLPRTARESAHAEVYLKESKVKGKKECTCEVIMHLPHEVITTQEATLNMFAAIDIVEAKLKNRLKKYKERHSTLRLHRRVIARFRRKR